jgi:hypothetical protein
MYILKRSDRIKNLVEADKINMEMKRYGSPKPVKELLDEYLFEDSNNLQKAKELCLFYKAQEPVVLLELVLWKNACFLNHARGTVDVVNYFVGGGWKSHKEANRHNALIETVVERVVPFLGLLKRDGLE